MPRHIFLPSLPRCFGGFGIFIKVFHLKILFEPGTASQKILCQSGCAYHIWYDVTRYTPVIIIYINCFYSPAYAALLPHAFASVVLLLMVWLHIFDL